MPKQVIKPGFFSGNNGPGFYNKRNKSTYEDLRVDSDEYRIHSPITVDVARARIAQNSQKSKNYYDSSNNEGSKNKILKKYKQKR